jgi:hypothetical protein
MVATPNGGGKIERLTVRQALKRYIEYKRTRGQPVYDVQSRGTAHILPSGENQTFRFPRHRVVSIG